MRVTFAAAIFGLANIVASQGQLPACAQTCVTQATSGSNIGDCSSLNIVCICSSSSFLASIACCLSTVCGPADQAQAVSFARNFCAASGVTNLPSSVVCSTAKPSSTSGSSSSAAIAKSTGSSQASSATSQASSAASQASSATSSPTTSAPAASATGKSGAQKVVGVGAGVLGGLAIGVALL